MAGMAHVVAIQDCFLGGEITNLLFSYFEGSNWVIIGREEEMRGSMVKCGERAVRGRGEELCEIPVRLSMNYGAMETVKYIRVDIWCMLDWIIGLCHKTAEIHFPGMSCSTSECTK